MEFIDYSKEPRTDIAFFDMKSFYASVESVDDMLSIELMEELFNESA